MWFKQIQLFHLNTPLSFSASEAAERMSALAFTPCFPSMSSSIGWVAPIEEEGEALVRGINGCMMVCLQIEEKILPANVVAQTLKDKIKEIEMHEARKVRSKEKLSFKDEIIHTLLPRAFSKLTRIYGYIDTRNHWLLVNTASQAKAESFITLFKKSFGDIVGSYDVIKPSAILTHWLKDKGYPQAFSIEKTCVLQDPNQQNRVIRCQQQDLFASSIQSLLTEGCEVIQLGLCWQDRIQFVLSDDFQFKNVSLHEDDIADLKDELETAGERFDADFILMTETLTGLITDILAFFMKGAASVQKQRLALVG